MLFGITIRSRLDGFREGAANSVDGRTLGRTSRVKSRVLLPARKAMPCRHAFDMGKLRNDSITSSITRSRQKERQGEEVHPWHYPELAVKAEHAARQMACEVRREIIAKPFGTTDRDRCRKERSAFCGCWIYMPGLHKHLELWLCEDHTGETFASDNIDQAKAFPMHPSREERSRLRAITESFATEVKDGIASGEF